MMTDKIWIDEAAKLSPEEVAKLKQVWEKATRGVRKPDVAVAFSEFVAAVNRGERDYAPVSGACVRSLARALGIDAKRKCEA